MKRKKNKNSGKNITIEKIGNWKKLNVENRTKLKNEKD